MRRVVHQRVLEAAHRLRQALLLSPGLLYLLRLLEEALLLLLGWGL